MHSALLRLHLPPPADRLPLKHSLRVVLVTATFAVLAACGRERPRATLFELLSPDATGVTFANKLPEDTAFNILNYLYYYNGGGVAAGDVNNDGLPDLYFSSNLGENRLYLNKGNYRFDDVTARAGVPGPPGWKSGVTMADVDGDGWLDIYVSAVSYLGMRGHNVLYINNRDGTFTDRTSEYGLDFEGYSTQALFFDYDGDGDLDMYLLNSSVHSERGVAIAPNRTMRNPRAGDRLYRNDGGHFVDVSERAHIYGGVEGYGLGVVASDFNGDGCMDLYVANDFQENDFLYLNNCDGTFTESVASAMKHTSHFSMGVDAADVNNDLRPDLIVLDMLPEREDILKSTASTESYALYDAKVRAGYFPQLERNTLQLNLGTHPDSRIPLFSDVSFLDGIAATDWSWAPLFADFDNDGLKDLFITNGIYRRPNDLDYGGFIGSRDIQTSISRGVGTGESTASILKRMPSVPLSNYAFAFQYESGRRFTNVAEKWGLAQPGFSNGAVYVDLNNSGALDLVVNNVNAPASIYRNHLHERYAQRRYLRVELKGEGKNTAGIGARVVVKADGRTQMLEQMPTRGFESSVDPRLHFGLGSAQYVEWLTVTWPDRRVQTLGNLPVDTAITLYQRAAHSPSRLPPPASRLPLFEDVTAKTGIAFRHRENDYSDFAREPLIPHKLSTEGPALAVGDVNSDSLDDIYIGGARGQAGVLYLQQRDGTFRRSNVPAFARDSAFEDVDAAFFDANGDGRPDLYVVSGGYEFGGESDALQDRLYLNDGNGHFQRDTTAIPRLRESGSVVAPADFNGDGHIDVFIGRRAVAGKYGVSPRSYLLQNDGHGRFFDVTTQLGDSLLGMVTSAAWTDYDRDGKLDLVVVGEWMPVLIFHQENGRFVDRATQLGFQDTDGWWFNVTAADVNGDGRPDLVLGNVGLNSYLKASPEQSARLYVGDFAHDGRSEPILATSKDGAYYPVAGRDELIEIIPQLRDKFPTYASFAGKRVDQIFGWSDLRKATELKAEVFASVIAFQQTDGKFSLASLPGAGQFSAIYASVVEDFDGDGRKDVLAGGNLYGVNPLLGRYDASYGTLAHNTGGAFFEDVGIDQSGLVIDGQVRHMKIVRTARGPLIAVARNDDSVQILRPTH